MIRTTLKRRGKNTKVPEGLIQLERWMFREITAYRDPINENTGFDSIVENQSLITYDAGTDAIGVSELPIKMFILPSGITTFETVGYSVEIHLGSIHRIDSMYGLYVRDPFLANLGYGSPHLRVTFGLTLDAMGNEQEITPANTETDEVRTDFAEPIYCRYIRFAFAATGKNFRNLMPKALTFKGTPVNGYKVKESDLYNTTGVSRGGHLPFEQFAGVNSVREDDNNLLNDHYTVSEQHRIFACDTQLWVGEAVIIAKSGNTITIDLNQPFDPYPNDRIGFNPAQGGGDFDFDTFFTTMTANGLHPIPVIGRTIPYLNVPDDNTMSNWTIPVDEDGDPLNPLDYKAFASLMFQFGARYGSQTVDVGLLKLWTGNTAQTGLNLVHAVAIMNEADKHWQGDESFAEPKQMAAWISAIVDGHMGLMGPGHGIRTADPNMKLMLNGFVEIRTDYIHKVIDELVAIRKDAPSLGYPINPLNDNFIIDIHTYPAIGGQDAAAGAAPIEQTEFLHESERFLKEIKYRLPNAELALSETGYDSCVDSPIGVPTTPGDVADPVATDIFDIAQARHIFRLMMYAYFVGYDKMYLFTLKSPLQVGASGYRNKFSTMGLFRFNGDKKLSWYMFNTLRIRLTGYVYQNHTIDEVNNLHIVKLSNSVNDAYVLWIGSNDDSVISGHVLNLGGKTSANRIDYAFGIDAGNTAAVTVTSGEVTLNITETPFILIAS